MKTEVAKQLEILTRGTVDITPHDEFVKMLENSLEKNTPLRVKCGIDPTNTDIHLGHLIPFKKMRQFQDLGHKGVVIIGDYTAQIGDPTGKTESRPSLTFEDVKRNAETYMEQVYTVLDPDKTEIRWQSEWFKDKSLADVLGWAAQTTVAQLLSHDTFKNRLESGSPLGLHELFYPVLQGIDSVFIEADVELGGSDQRFNVLMGREFQRARNQRPQVALLMPLLTGLCGTAKMSKSLGNVIGVNDEPFDKFGKVMSIPDTLIHEYFKLALFSTEDKLNHIQSGLANQGLHPNIVKKELAEEIVGIFHSKEVALEMRSEFEKVFAKGKVPDDTPEYTFKVGSTLLDALVKSKLVSSNSEVRRLVKQKAIGLVDGGKFIDAEAILNEEHDGKVIKVGKRRFLKMKV